MPHAVVPDEQASDILWEEDLVGPDGGYGPRSPRITGGAGLILQGARDRLESLATTRSVGVLIWQLTSAVVLLGMLAWMLWFPLAAGSGALSLVASDGRMSPTILRGDVVVVRPSPDLPYPIDVIIAFRQDGELFTERVVGEEYEGNLRLLITASDAVPTGVDRRVDPDDVIGSVRQVHRSLGYPALWFGEPGMLLPRLLVVLLALSSAVGTASMVVRWEMRRSDRALVSAIASGARNQLPH